MQNITSLTLLILVLFIGTAFSQEVTGNLEGRVLIAPGETLTGVNITIRGASLQGVRSAISHDRGYFRILALPVGLYSVKLSHAAYQEVTYENVSIRLGKTRNLGEILLTERIVGMPEVVVNGERPLIDPTSTTIGANFRTEVLQTLPLQRDYASVVVLTPQANAGSHPDDGVNVGGASGWDNTFYIDGIHVTDPAQGNTGTALPYNFIQEVEVKTGGYQAEFGRTLGGIVNVVTRTGSNKFEAQAFGFLTNSGLTGERRGTPGGTRIQSFCSSCRLLLSFSLTLILPFPDLRPLTSVIWQISSSLTPPSLQPPTDRYTARSRRAFRRRHGHPNSRCSVQLTDSH